MSSWIGLSICFVVGLVVGVGFAFVHLNSRLQLYRRYIERRLDSSGSFLPSRDAVRRDPGSKLLETHADRGSKPGKGSDSPAND